MDTEAIEKKIETLKSERDQFVMEANSQVAFFNGQIAALQNLLAPEEEEQKEQDG